MIPILKIDPGFSRWLFASVAGTFVAVAINVIAFGQEALRPPIVIADFEGSDYGAWKTSGDAFGKGPAQGTLPGQMNVEGFIGKGLVNSFLGGDGAIGKLTSPRFKIERKSIHFLIGGGGWENKTCINLVIDGKVVLTANGPNTESGGSELLQTAGWDVSEFMGRDATLVIVDEQKGGWGHINVDHIVQTDAKVPLESAMTVLEKTLTVNGSHLIVPVANNTSMPNNEMLLGIFDGESLVQSFNVRLPQGDEVSWLAAYPLNSFAFNGKQIKIASADHKRLPEACRAAFDRIQIGKEADARSDTDYAKPYRNQFHPSTRRGWNNDPNGMVFHNGKYHLYYQHNPFGIGWGNMHWGHFESKDMIHWMERPIAFNQKTVSDMAFSGGGFVDVNNTSGLGKNTLFVAFTSTGRGECLAYSQDDGMNFKELEENPVVKHVGRDPKVIWYAPEQKWVMVLYDETSCPETEAVPPTQDKGLSGRNMAFYESKNLRQWTRTGAFTDPDREAVFECPEMFELPVVGKAGESRWILLGAQNRYFVGTFDGKTFHKESGPHGTTHGALYAAQTFSDVPDGRRIQIGWVRTAPYLQQFPDQMVDQSFSLPHTMTLRPTRDGLRVFFAPVIETEQLRGELLIEGKELKMEQANAMLQKCKNELTEVAIEFSQSGPKQLLINGIDASFDGSTARIFTDRTFNEVYADDGISYELRTRDAKSFSSTETQLTIPETCVVRSLRMYRLKSIWK
jgi:fructan beta-fructosidase